MLAKQAKQAKEESESDEKEGLLEKEEKEEKEVKYKWTHYHTFTLICLRLCGDVIVMSTLMFDDRLAIESLTTLSTFSIVNILRFFGTIIAILAGPFNIKYFKNNNKKITVIYSILCSVITILFGSVYGIRSFYPNKYMIIISQSVIWLIFGAAFAILNAATIAFSTTYSDPAKHGAILSLISFSWSLASLFYVIVAYLITIHASLPFIVFGTLLLIFAALIHFTYHFESDNNNNKIGRNSSEAPESVHYMKEINDVFGNTQYGLLIFISCIIGIASGANTAVLGSPILHDLYHLNLNIIGWCTLITFLGEFTSNLCMVQYSDKYGYYVTASIGLTLKFIAGILIIFISIYYDKSSWMSLIITLFMVFVVSFGWEVFFVTQLTAINNAIQSQKTQKKRMVFLCHNGSLAIIKPVGIWFATYIWDDGHGLIWVGFLFIITSLMASFFYLIYHNKYNNKFIYQNVRTKILK